MANETRSSGGGGGIGCLGALGFIIAFFTSLALGNPVGWVIIHTLCGWFYLAWVCLGCGGQAFPWYGDWWSTPAVEYLQPAAAPAEE